MLYHRDIYLPPELVKQFDGRKFILDLTRHAIQAAAHDRYGAITIPRVVSVVGTEIVEAEIELDKVRKIVLRQSYDETRDLILVLVPDGMRARVKTVWLNLKADTHKTLRADVYACA